MHEELKAALGIESANCASCCHLSQESEGDYGQYTYFLCDDTPGKANLKSFPFKKEQACWQPDFWATKLAAEIKFGEQNEYDRLYRKFTKIVEATRQSQKEV